jgi:preprotein translocase subunit SecG
MQPIDQAVTIFMAAVFVIFSLGLAYATWLGGTEKKKDDKKR